MALIGEARRQQQVPRHRVRMPQEQDGTRRDAEQEATKRATVRGITAHHLGHDPYGDWRREKRRLQRSAEKRQTKQAARQRPSAQTAAAIGAPQRQQRERQECARPEMGVCRHRE
jgi:hypothetical protein